MITQYLAYVVLTLAFVFYVLPLGIRLWVEYQDNKETQARLRRLRQEEHLR